jgi:Ca2+-transporting ATPase
MDNYHAQTIENIFAKLKSRKEGLKKEDAIRRLAKHGLNKLGEEKKKSSFAIFVSQFKSPLILILVIAGIISLIFQEYINSGVIFGSVFLNTLIGFFQENKANSALAKLKMMVEHKAIVVREGEESEIDSSQLTIGDIIILSSGNRVPADARVIEAADLETEEASLTGESIPSVKTVKKLSLGVALADRENMVYAGTIIVRGRGMAIVTQIGRNTEIGKIASLVENTKEESTPLQARLNQLSKTIGKLVLGICFVIVIIGYFQGRDLVEMIVTGIAIAVASVPEGLAVAVTVILVLGMQRIFKKNALVRKLLAAETLGSATVICADKTGTLTEGKMSVAYVVFGNEEKKLNEIKIQKDQDINRGALLPLKIAALCNDAFAEKASSELERVKLIGVPTEVGLLLAAYEVGLEKAKLLKKEPLIAELPFSNQSKFMITLHEQADKTILYEKGAPEMIIKKSKFQLKESGTASLSETEKNELIKRYEKLTRKGLRVLAVAYRILNSKIDHNGTIDWVGLDRELIFAGFIALKDPLRPEARDTIRLCRRAGIKPIIITGDHRLTAQAIAKELELPALGENIMTGEELEKIDDKKLEELVSRIEIFARVSPHHKLRIVRALQNRGESVAMTGDGINDSPALKAADIGVALGNGTDIAKENSDIILLDNNFKTIVSAVLEGRIIFFNIRKVLTYLLSDGFSEVILIIGSMLMNLPLAIVTTQILWINIAHEGFPNFALAFEKEEDGMMEKRPFRRDEPILNKQMKIIIFGVSIVRDFFILGIYVFLLKTGNSLVFCQTMVFAMVGVCSLMAIFSLRSFSRPIWKINPFSNIYLVFAILFSLVLLLAAVYLPGLQKIVSTTNLSWGNWLAILAVGLANIAAIEIIKLFFRGRETDKVELGYISAE